MKRIRLNAMLAAGVAASAVMALSTSVAARQQQQKDDIVQQNSERTRYDGHKIVRAFIRNADDLALMDAISPDMWSESDGIGPVDYRIPPENKPLLDQSGIQYEVRIENVQTLIDEESKKIHERGGENIALGPQWYLSYHNLADVMTYLDDLAAQFPNLADVTTIGTSIEGRPIRALHITGAGGPNRPTIVIESNQHAREWVTLPGTMYIAEQLLTNYGTDPDITALVNDLNIHVIVSVNPDGYNYTWTNKRLWRKNRRNNGGGSYGVDPNRNWATGWGGEGSSGDKWSDIYRGTAPFSEPETQTMRDFMNSLPRVDGFIDYHSYSQLVLQPWGYTRTLPPDHAVLDQVGGLMASAAQSLYGKQYVHGPSYTTIYPASGVAGDWPYDALGALAYTIEMRDQGQFGFLLPENQITPAAEEGFAAFLQLAQFINQDCLGLTVDNLVSNKQAIFAVSGATPGATVAVLYSTQTGQFSYSSGGWCLDFGLKIPANKAPSRVVVMGVANSSGNYTNSKRIPGSAQGLMIHFQAGEKDTCPDSCMSNIVSDTVQ